MPFEWQPFLDKHGIEYVTRGPNVARNHVAVACPFCGDDPSHHLGISLEGKGWGCWRDARHRGRHPRRLVQALLSCSFTEAERLAGGPPLFTLDDHVLAQRVRQLCTPGEAPHRLSPLGMLPSLRSLSPEGRGAPFWNYLEKRGYRHDEILDVAAYYGLRYAVEGFFRGRLVFPVAMRSEQGPVQYTGRAVGRGQPRYLALPSGDTPPTKTLFDVPCASVSIGNVLWNYHNLAYGGECLVVTEGPFDAMWIDWLGKEVGIRAVCLFGTGNLGPVQEALLARIEGFEKRILLLDADAAMRARAIVDRLAYAGFRCGALPAGVKDPAGLSRDAVVTLFA